MSIRTIVLLIFFLHYLLPSSILYSASSSRINEQEQIKQLCVDRSQKAGDFSLFAGQLKRLGIIRQTYDVLENTLYFYAKNRLVYQLPIRELPRAKNQQPQLFGAFLDEAMVKKAIENLDNQRSTVFEFHRQLAKAGVVYVSVFLLQHEIYYLGQDGKFFLEKY